MEWEKKEKAVLTGGKNQFKQPVRIRHWIWLSSVDIG